MSDNEFIKINNVSKNFENVIAVNNVNLAALYDCYPKKVAWVSFISFILALFFLPLGLLGLF